MEVEVETEVGSVVGIIQIEEVDTEEEVVVAMEVAKDDMMMVVNITYRYEGPDHVQVFWKYKSIGNQGSYWLTR